MSISCPGAYSEVDWVDEAPTLSTTLVDGYGNH